MVNLELPPLRERKEDIPLLIERFIKEFSEDNNRQVDSVEPAAMKFLCEYPWPGNIRELRNCVENMVVRTTGNTLTEALIPTEIKEQKMIQQNSAAANPGIATLEDTEWNEIERALERCNGNRTKAAEMLGISRRTLHRRLQAQEEK